MGTPFRPSGSDADPSPPESGGRTGTSSFGLRREKRGPEGSLSGSGRRGEPGGPATGGGEGEGRRSGGARAGRARPARVGAGRGGGRAEAGAGPERATALAEAPPGATPRRAGGA